MATKKKSEVELGDLIRVQHERIRYHVVGMTPMIIRRLSEKAKGELLMPAGRKSSAEKATSLKHNPITEFRDSPYTLVDDNEPTLLAQPSACFKRAIATAAIDIPGAAKAQIGRLLWVNREKTPIYGIPKLHMCITRDASIARTPDVRTRCIIPEWAAIVDVTYVTPIIREPVVSGLLAAAGITQGIGDWRPQKGAGTYGQFQIVDPDDDDFVRIAKAGCRAAQQKAMRDAEPYDRETEELLAWFVKEADRRGIREVLS